MSTLSHDPYTARMSRILILGAHGHVALLAARKLVEGGDEVTAMIRNPAHRQEIADTGAAPLVADLEQLDVDAMAEHFAGFDAIVWSAGAGGGDPLRTRAVDHDAAVRSMRAAVQAGVSRYVMVSYFGSSRAHGVDADNPFYAYAEAKSLADEVLRSSKLDWTVLGPSRLTFAEGSGRIDTTASESGEVSRANVAEVIQAVLAQDQTIGRTIRFNDGETEIAQAIAM